MKKSILALVFSTSFVFADFIGLTPAQLQEKIDKKVVVIDIRTPPEWLSTGVIPTSKKIMFFNERGAYDVGNWMKEFSKHIKQRDQEFVLVCRSGNRTTTVGNFLANQLKFKNVYHLQNGIKSWIGDKRKVQK